MNPLNIRPFKNISPVFGKNNYIDISAVIIGEVTTGDNVSIWPLVAIRGDVNHIVIGDRSNVQDGSVLHVTHKNKNNPDGYPLIIGDDVTIGHKCMLHGCTIGNRILIGMGAIIMDNAVVEDDVFIGAGTLVPPGKILKSGYLYVGNPMKQARELTEAELDFLKRSADNYVRFKDEYLAEL